MLLYLDFNVAPSKISAFDSHVTLSKEINERKKQNFLIHYFIASLFISRAQDFSVSQSSRSSWSDLNRQR